MGHPVLFRSKRKILLPLLLTLGLLCIAISTSYSFSFPNDNALTVTGSQGLRVTVTPDNITVPQSLSSFVKIEITVQSKIPFSNLSVNVIEAGNTVQQNNFHYNTTTFAVVYDEMPYANHGINTTLAVKAQNSGSAFLPFTWVGSYNGFILEFVLYAGIGCLVTALILWEFRKRSIWPFLPVFVGISILFGQRYDDFIIISSGFRVIYGLNPYQPSSALLPGLQWAYPPGYILWSYFVDWLYRILPFSSAITNSSMNYIGTEYGNPFGAWKGLLGSNLLLLYGLIKLPLVLSFFWIFNILKGLTGKEHWKLWFFNPFMIVIGVMWGQLDVLAAAFMLQAILFESNGKTWWAVLFASIGGAVKIFPVLIIPYILLGSKHRSRDLTAILPVLAITLLIYQFTGGIYGSVYALLFARAIPTYGGIFISNGLSWQVLITYFGFTSFPSLFLWVFTPAFFLITGISLWKKVPLLEYATLILLIFFLTYNFVNPQYLIWVIPLLLALKREAFALLTSAIGSIFMVLTYSFTYFLNPAISWNYQSSALGQIEGIKVLLLGSATMRAALAIVATIIFSFMLLKIWNEAMSAGIKGSDA